MNYIERHTEKLIRKYAGEFPCIMVTGARQTGKTTLLRHIASDVPYLTFDDPLQERSVKTDAQSFMQFHPYPQIFDEIQYVPELFRYLKMRIDADRQKGMYYLTGSQTFQLREKAAETLSGRIGLVSLMPLSAREIQGDAYDSPFVPDDVFFQTRLCGELALETLWEMIFKGGYPEVAKGALPAADFYPNYIKTYIERDILSSLNVADEMSFLNFMTIVATRTGQLLNYADIADECSVSAVTVKKWLSLLVSSGIVCLLPPYSANVEKRVVKTPKLYFVDTGLATYLTGWADSVVLRSGAMSGAIFETYVISEILKSFCNAGRIPPLYFYRDKDKVEIDLIIADNRTLYPVEIKKTATPSDDDAKNFYVLKNHSSAKIARNTIVCCCSSPVTVAKKGVRAVAMPVWWI